MWPATGNEILFAFYTVTDEIGSLSAESNHRYRYGRDKEEPDHDQLLSETSMNRDRLNADCV